MRGRTNNLTRPGMTLVELLVAVAILVMMIAGVGYIFSNTSQAVRQAQAVIDTNAAIRIAAGRLREDLEAMSPDGFLCLIGRGWGDSGTVNPPVLMFVASGSFTSNFDSTVTANEALIVYTLVNDTGSGEASILARYQFLLTGNTGDDSLRDLIGNSLNPSPDDLDWLCRQDRLNVTLADIRRLIVSDMVNDGQVFALDFVGPLLAYGRLNSAPATVSFDTDDGWGGIVNLWPYLVGGCETMDLAFTDGYGVDFGNTVPYPGQPIRWIRMACNYNGTGDDGRVDRDGDGTWDRVTRDPDEGPIRVDDIEPYPDGNGTADSLEAREQRGDDPLEGVYFAAEADDAVPMIIWCHRVKSQWPKALRLTLHLRDVGERLDEPREFELVLPLPTKD